MTAKAAHLKTMPVPAWLATAMNHVGTTEVAGKGSNPKIIGYRSKAGIKLGGEDSVVPWCAIFINAMLAWAGVRGTESAAARSFAASPLFEKLKEPMVGCITVISSNRGPASGHVFFYIGENGLFFQGLGGNQNDAVTDDGFFQKKKLVGHYWPKGQPKPKAPYDRPYKLARPLLPHEKKPVRDA